MSENKRGLATDAWIMAIPESPYDLCPCGCGMKFRFAMKGGIGEHEDKFIETFIETLNIPRINQ